MITQLISNANYVLTPNIDLDTKLKDIIDLNDSAPLKEKLVRMIVHSGHQDIMLFNSIFQNSTNILTNI